MKKKMMFPLCSLALAVCAMFMMTGCFGGVDTGYGSAEALGKGLVAQNATKQYYEKAQGKFASYSSANQHKYLGDVGATQLKAQQENYDIQISHAKKAHSVKKNGEFKYGENNSLTMSKAEYNALAAAYKEVSDSYTFTAFKLVTESNVASLSDDEKKAALPYAQTETSFKNWLATQNNSYINDGRNIEVFSYILTYKVGKEFSAKAGFEVTNMTAFEVKAIEEANQTKSAHYIVYKIGSKFFTSI